MVSTFVTQVPSMTIHMMHGESEFVLYAQGGTLTSQRKLHMGAGLDSAQAFSSGVFRIAENTRFFVTINRSARA